MKAIVEHVLSALQDCLFITALPKTSIKGIKDFTFIRNGSRSAYNQDTIEKSIQYFMKALTYLNEYEQRKSQSILMPSANQ